MPMETLTQHWIDVLAVIEGMLFGLEANAGLEFNHETSMVRGASNLIYQAIDHFQSLINEKEQDPAAVLTVIKRQLDEAPVEERRA